ncbi:non-ribosomal peptide synthetase component E (peptide arylation enzyme) [Bradyrhizobium sp. GM24.11]
MVHGYPRQWARARPRERFLAERSADGGHWQTISYGEAHDAATRLATSFAARGLGPQRPILILSGNSIKHQLVALAAMMAGIPYTPLSVAYSTMSGDFGKLRAILRILDPGLVFSADAAPFARALAIDDMSGRDIVLGRNHEIVKGAISLAYGGYVARCPSPQPASSASELPVSGIPDKPFRLKAEALHSSLDHGPCCANLSLANGSGSLDVNDDAKLHVDEIVVGVRTIA